MIHENFLSVRSSLMGHGLKAIDILIAAKVQEFGINELECYITNETFSEMFGESVSTVRRSIERLIKLSILEKSHGYVGGYGRGNYRRTLKMLPMSNWDIELSKSDDDNGVFYMSSPSEENDNGVFTESSPSDNGVFKSDEWGVHIEQLIDNKKDNNTRKDNNTNITTNKKEQEENIVESKTEDNRKQNKKTKKDKSNSFYPSVDTGRFVSSLSLDDYNRIYDIITNHPDYGKLHDMFHNDYNVHISDFKVLRDEMIRQSDLFAQKKKNHTKNQLDSLRNMSIDDIKDIVSSCDVYSEDMKDDEYDYKAHMIRSILRDRFGISSGVTQSNSELCVTMLRFAQSGDRDRFVDDTEEW